MEMVYSLTDYREPALEDTLLEHWTQDASDPDLWHGPQGLIVNSAALAERRPFYTLLLHKAA